MWKIEDHIKKLSEKQKGGNNSMYGKTYDESPHAKSIICIETQKRYLSEREAAEAINVCESSLSNCLSGRSKTAGGFHWEYA